MKQTRGIWLPDDDDHFEGHLVQGPEFEGAGTYQYNKIVAALAQVHDHRRRVAVDVGGHVGLWSRVIARAFERVVAFEPVPAMIECFLANVQHLDNVELRELAVSDAAGELLIERVEGNSGNSRVVTIADPSTERSIVRAQAVRLDDAFKDISVNAQVDFIKVDVEGWELQVVRGAEALIRNNRPIMVVEQKPGHAERYGGTRTAAVGLLESWGAVTLWQKAGDYCLGWR